MKCFPVEILIENISSARPC